MLLLWLASSIAHADDWLALYPECAFPSDARALGRMAVLYPRPGFPAVVEAGDRLVARVRVPSGLTPPPGMQQDRALHGWSAELTGLTGERIDDLENRYDLRVIDVRPDGGSSLVYRASTRIPAWAAPGTYSLHLTAPGGSESLPSSVRIVESGATPRVAAIAGDRTYDAAWATRPADVWVVDRLGAWARGALADPRGPAVLALSSGTLDIALRVGADDLWVLGGCDTPSVRFRDAVSGIERRERRDTIAFDATRLVTGPASGELLDGTPLGADVEYTEVYPLDFAATFAEGTEVAFYPATALHAATSTPAVAARIRTAAAGANRRLERANLEPITIVFDPPAPEAGPVRLHLSGGEWQTVGWQLDEDTTAVGAEITHAFTTVGPHEVRALAIRADGAAALASAVVEIHPQRAKGCDCAAGGTSVLPAVVPGSVFVLAFLLQTGRRRKYTARRSSF